MSDVTVTDGNRVQLTESQIRAVFEQMGIGTQEERDQVLLGWLIPPEEDEAPPGFTIALQDSSNPVDREDD